MNSNKRNRDRIANRLVKIVSLHKTASAAMEALCLQTVATYLTDGTVRARSGPVQGKHNVNNFAIYLDKIKRARKKREVWPPYKHIQMLLAKYSTNRLSICIM
jgi:hypothetical protein